MPMQAASDDAEATIRELRSRSNAAIARHDVAAAVAIMRDDVRIVASSGELFDGAAAMAKAFDRSFSDPAFVTYVRGPQSIEVSDAAAVEIGRWEGRWKTRLVRGAYMARWQHEQIGWRIAAELFVPLAIDEQPAAGAP